MYIVFIAKLKILINCVSNKYTKIKKKLNIKLIKVIATKTKNLILFFSPTQLSIQLQ